MIAAYAPATVSNVACGFDVLGFALDAPGDERDALGHLLRRLQIERLDVHDAAEADPHGLDVVLFSAGATTSRALAEKYANAEF